MSLALKPTHAAVKNYYAALHQVGQLHFNNEAQVSDAFAKLLADCGRKLHLTFIPQFPIQRAKTRVIVDGALLDTFHLAHGYWEAKDEKDDLDREIKAKLDKGYPRDNIIFQAPERAVLYQAGARVADEDISKPDYLVQLVNHFFGYKAPHIEEWEQAVSEFSNRIPELAAAVKKIIDAERKHSPAFVRSFEDFYALCRQAINPNLSEEAVERMLIQHLLTERIFERIFDNPDFTRRNVVAAEIEKVIVELTKRAFNRNEFLRPLDRFYKAIEVSAENTSGFSEKQAFLNKVYERFFQGYSPKEADTHGIVYTPQPIVNFMVRSVEEILQKEFGRSLGDKGVHILDPFVGTGNFIVRIMQEIKATDLQYKYENELHCNEVMLLPYYIASMNIEHAYFERTGEYSAFPGICLVDTFELAEHGQAAFGFMAAENAERVKRQKQSPIFVIIGNPPYNAGQQDENDRNRNRTYAVIDRRVTETYVHDSTATLRNSLGDPYVKAIRWASDRVGEDAIVALVTNNGFVDSLAFDGMRKHLETDFSSIYHINLKGNARTTGETRQKEGGNVFEDAIRVGVGITFLIRRRISSGPAEVWRYDVADHLRGAAKQKLLTSFERLASIPVELVRANEQHSWLAVSDNGEFSTLTPIGDKHSKGDSSVVEGAIFGTFTNGAKSNSDSYVFNFSLERLRQQASRMVEAYNVELDRWKRMGSPTDVDSFIQVDETKLKWIRHTKRYLLRGKSASLALADFRTAIYRPFCKQSYFFNRIFNEDLYRLPLIFPDTRSEQENAVIAVVTEAQIPFSAQIASVIPCLHYGGRQTQCFPFYTYAEDGTHRRENITDWALEQFRAHYHDPSITKWDIFHYIYAVLHHPEYRERYATNLRRELPRIPFATSTPCHPEAAESSAKPRTPNEEPALSLSKGPMQLADTTAAAGKSIGPSARKERGPQDDKDVFRAFVATGQRLAEIHVHYEQQPEYKLTKVEKKGEKLDYCVTKMKLSKDKTTLIYNQFLTLSGIPKATYDYRLGNRSALEWVIDQYQVSTDKRSGITNDPNRADDPQYILRLIGQVITVSLETVAIVGSLPSLRLPQ